MVHGVGERGARLIGGAVCPTCGATYPVDTMAEDCRKRHIGDGHTPGTKDGGHTPAT